jgi:DNA-binding MarR family transcriptional regulator
LSNKDRSDRRAALSEAIALAIRRGQNWADAYDEAVSEAVGINRTDLRCLDIIDQNREITAGRLAEQAGLTTGAMTTVLDRLERAGYARRVRDAADRRRVLVEVTDEARRKVWPYYEPMAELGNALASHYSDEELEVLLDYFERAAAMTEGMLERVAAVRPAS